MDYRRYGSDIMVRLDVGEDICEQVLAVARKENITLASVSAIGATNDFTVGVFDLEDKSYDKFSYKGNYEIAALNGNITVMNGEPYAHLHISCAGGSGEIIGGHLFNARISLTCELAIRVYDGGFAERKHDDKMNFNRMEF